MTDSSTSPVPPKEIERAIDKLADVMYWRGFKSYTVRDADIDGARAALRSAIASYTLSPEEARIAYHAVAPSGLLAAHLSPEERAAATKLERIASTEEASQ